MALRKLSSRWLFSGVVMLLEMRLRRETIWYSPFGGAQHPTEPVGNQSLAPAGRDETSGKLHPM
jgi:hypothetical protein